MSDAQDRMMASLNRLCKWRSVLAGQHVGTKPAADPETKAFRDLYDKLLILRAENSALVSLLLSKGVVTMDELAAQTAIEADVLEQAYEEKFPGVRATSQGLVIDRSAEPWLRQFKP